MFHAKDGVYFEQQPDGSVRVLVKADGRDDAELLKDIALDADSWASIIATMSYYGEEDYGFYRACQFHSGRPIDATTPMKKKPPKWKHK